MSYSVIKPAVLLTGYLDNEIAMKAKQAGFSDMLPKDKLSKSSILRILASSLNKYDMCCQKVLQDNVNKTLFQKHMNIVSVYQTIYHELKTPLAAVNQYLSFILEGSMGELPNAHKTFLKYAYKQCQLMTLFTHNLLGAGQVMTGKFDLDKKKIIIDETIKSAIQLLTPSASIKNINLCYHPIMSNIDALIDESRLLQVISNLIKYSYSDSEINVYSYLLDNNHVCISVKDSGCGIDPKDQQDIFDRLYQVNQNGNYEMGLGLSLCSKLAQMHQGKLWVESQVGKGSTFYVQLPIR